MNLNPKRTAIRRCTGPVELAVGGTRRLRAPIQTPLRTRPRTRLATRGAGWSPNLKFPRQGRFAGPQPELGPARCPCTRSGPGATGTVAGSEPRAPLDLKVPHAGGPHLQLSQAGCLRHIPAVPCDICASGWLCCSISNIRA